MEQLLAYICFWLRSTNQHGVHSPFVYDLVTRCFYDKSQHPAYATLKDHRDFFLKDASSIEVTDFGAGSRVFNSNSRKVAKIAKTAGITKKRQRLLFRLMQYLNIKNSLELGTSLGLATAAMSLGQPGASIHTVEGCPQTAQKAHAGFDAFHLDKIALHIGAFDDFLDQLTADTTFDLIYLDGNHDEQHTIDYFNKLIHHKNLSSVMVLDDINWSKGMQRAWQYVKGHPEVTVTIDTFFWGLVFFRKEQAPQHFTIRL